MTNSSFTRTDFIVVTVALLFFGCLLFPALAQSNSHADVAACLNKLRALAEAIQKHHDTRLCIPLASKQPIDHKPGSADESNAAGYSWLVQLTPFLENEHKLGEEFFKGKLVKAAFDPDSTISENGKTVHFASVAVQDFICPSFKGDAHVSASDSEYKPFADGSLPAISNYNALAGTHFLNADGLGRMVPPDKLASASFAYEGNGAMPFPGMVGGKLQKTGLGFQSFPDGLSNTIDIAETIEPAESAWYDGQTAWLIAAWPGNEKIPTMQPSPQNPNMPILQWSDDDKKTSKVTVNLRGADGTPTTYLAAGRWSGGKERRYAASSNHPGIVGHAYLDGHAEMIASDIDPNIYIHLVTRGGHETIPDDFKKQQAKMGFPLGLSLDDEGKATKPAEPLRAIEIVPDQWAPVVEWSPLAIGDLRLRFPELLAAAEFVPDPRDPTMRTYGGTSSVFSEIEFDPKAMVYLFVVDRQEATKAMPKLYKQLSAALGQPTKKEIDQHPKRITWKKDAKFPAGTATFEIVLTEASEKTLANIAIRATSN